MMTAMVGKVGRRSTGAAALVVTLALTSCSRGENADVVVAATTSSTSTTTTSTTTTTQPPATTSSTTTTSTTTTSTSTTSTSTTTTLPRQLSLPVDAPLDNGDEPVVELGTLLIPKIGVEMTMYEGIRMRTLDRGPGHWPGSAMPGEVGNVVVGGHRTSKHKVFRHVDQLVAGDEIIFRDPDGTEHRYLVNRVEVVKPDAIWIVNPTETPTATLFACHPPGSTRERIVVFADLQH